MKVLVISTVGLIYDGITSVIREYIKALNTENLEIYIVDTIQTETVIRNELEQYGCKFVSLPSRQTATVSYFFRLIHFIQKEHIEVLHAHGNSATLTIEMLAAFIGGCKRRIAHSHNTRCNQVKADRLLRPLFRHLYTDAVACGTEAGKWLFETQPFIVLNNGRDLQRFCFHQEVRKAIREEYNIGQRLTVGHVGGFVRQKNHVFLLEIYKTLIDIIPDICLFLIGDGVERENIEKIAKEYGIIDKIIFTGKTERVSELLQAMDVMVLPSLYEGLPLVSIEWQAAGLPCVLSDTITRECAVTDLVKFVSLSESAETWANMIIQSALRNERKIQSNNARIKIKNSGFDIKDNASVLRQLYFK